MKEIPIPIISEYQVLTYHTNKKRGEHLVIMCGITPKQEEALDNGETITVTKKDCIRNHGFVINPKQVYCYGEVDFSDDSKDKQHIEDFKFLDSLSAGGYPIDSFDYDKGILTGTWYDTWSPFTVCQLAHCHIGKPKRVAIFREK